MAKIKNAENWGRATAKERYAAGGDVEGLASNAKEDLMGAMRSKNPNEGEDPSQYVARSRMRGDGSFISPKGEWSK